MIDTPWGTTQFQPLLDSIELKHKKKVVLCIATHSHTDSPGGLDFVKHKGAKPIHPDKTTRSARAWRKRPEFVFLKDTTFTIGSYSFDTFYGGEGHTQHILRSA